MHLAEYLWHWLVQRNHWTKVLHALLCAVLQCGLGVVDGGPPHCCQRIRGGTTARQKHSEGQGQPKVRASGPGGGGGGQGTDSIRPASASNLAHAADSTRPRSSSSWPPVLCCGEPLSLGLGLAHAAQLGTRGWRHTAKFKLATCLWGTGGSALCHVLQGGRRLGQTLVGNTLHPHLRLCLLLRVLLSCVSGFGASTLRACWVTGMYSGGPSSCPSVSQACPFHSNGLLFSIYAGGPRIPTTSSQS